jgi:glycosyltransferase involved in cell wall biosynthesis
VVTEHNVWSSHSPLTRFADRATEGRSETHLAVSEAVRESLPRPIRSRTRVIRYGVDAAEIGLEREHRAEQRRLLGVDDDEIVIGTVANLRATKGYPDLLAAAREVVDRVPKARFVAVGRGPMEEELRARHHDLGLGAHFTFLGFRSDAMRVMSAFDVFCLPSHYEGLPIALMEAMALGLPAVATAVGGVGELVTDGTDAVLVPRGDPTRLAEALVTLALFPSRRAELGAAARTRSETFDAPKAVRAIEAVYAEVVGP